MRDSCPHVLALIMVLTCCPGWCEDALVRPQILNKDVHYRADEDGKKGLQVHEVFRHPWVQQNVALTRLRPGGEPVAFRDGIGAQLQRVLSVCALAKALGLLYQHAPIGPFIELSGMKERVRAHRGGTAVDRNM